MDAAKVYATLTEISRVQAELQAAHRAPPSHDERLAVAKAQLDHAGEQFRRQPFRIPSPAAVASALMGAMMALAPASAIEAVEKAIKATPPGLDTATKVARIAACEAKISSLARSLTPDDLRKLRREKDEGHTHLRALRSRMDELQQVIDRRQLAIAEYRDDRAELRRPRRRASDELMGMGMGALPDLGRIERVPPDFSAPERDIAWRAADQWLREAEHELAADIATLDEVRERYRVTADDWRRCCLWVEQFEKLTPVLPAAPLQGGR
jgi:hypothetical protein